MNLKNELINRAPTLLFSAGVAGFITAVVMSARATPKAMARLNELEHLAEEHGPRYVRFNNPKRVDKIKAVIPVYVPTAGMVLLSTGLLMASDRIVRNRYASLLTLYSVTERTLSSWKTATEESVTNKKFHEIKERVITPTEDPQYDERAEAEGMHRFWDLYSKRYFYAPSVDTVRRIFKDINLKLVTEDFIPLNDFYYLVGLDPVGYGNDVGWHVNDMEIEPWFDGGLIKDIPYIVVEYEVKPRKW